MYKLHSVKSLMSSCCAYFGTQQDDSFSYPKSSKEDQVSQPYHEFCTIFHLKSKLQGTWTFLLLLMYENSQSKTHSTDLYASVWSHSTRPKSASCYYLFTIHSNNITLNFCCTFILDMQKSHNISHLYVCLLFYMPVIFVVRSYYDIYDFHESINLYLDPILDCLLPIYLSICASLFICIYLCSYLFIILS